MSNLADDLRRHRAQHYSQNEEDGALARLLEIVGTSSRFYVEIGVGDGEECNTRLLRERGWSGIMMDCAASNPAIRLYPEFVTAENIQGLLIKYRGPRRLRRAVDRHRRQRLLDLAGDRAPLRAARRRDRVQPRRYPPALP